MSEQLSLRHSNMNVTRYPSAEQMSVLSSALEERFGGVQGLTLRHKDEEIHSLRPGVRLVTRTDMIKRLDQLPDLPYDNVAEAIGRNIAASLKQPRSAEFNSVRVHISGRNSIGYIALGLCDNDRSSLLSERNHIVRTMQRVCHMPPHGWPKAPLDLTVAEATTKLSSDVAKDLMDFLNELVPQKLLLEPVCIEASPSWNLKPNSTTA